MSRPTSKVYHDLRDQFMKSVEVAEKKAPDRDFGKFFQAQNQRNKGEDDRRFITVLDESGKLAPLDIGMRAQAARGIGNLINQMSDNRWNLNQLSEGDKSVSLSKDQSTSFKIPQLQKKKIELEKIKPDIKEEPNLAKQIKGMLLLNDPIKMLEHTRKNEAKYSFDSLDTFPTNIKEISKMPEELGQLGVQKVTQERLKNALNSGTSGHSIIKKNYFFLDETVDVDMYSEISNYSRKVVRHSK